MVLPELLNLDKILSDEQATVDLKAVWNGGYDSSNNYHEGAKQVGPWFASLDEIQKELAHQAIIDKEQRITRAYGFLSANEYPETGGEGRSGFILVARKPEK